MENLINNPILSIDIGHKILHLLDDESLQSCRMVNSSMKIMVGHPKFWLQKLVMKDSAQEHLMKWRNLVNFVGNENTELMENVTKCLMKMHQQFSKWSQAPIHVASKVGDVDLIQLIIEHGENSEEPNQYGNTPMSLAAGLGFLEVVKLVMSRHALTTQMLQDMMELHQF